MGVFFVRVEKIFCTRTKSIFIGKQIFFLRVRFLILSKNESFYETKFTISQQGMRNVLSYKWDKSRMNRKEDVGR